MKPAYRRNASCITPVCRTLHAAACCTTLACRLLQHACRLLQPAYPRMQAAAGITWMHTVAFWTRKPSYRWQTRATRKPAKNCSNSTSLQRCRWQYWPIFMRLTAIASEICEIPRNSLKIQTYGVQGHPRWSILVSIESPCTTSY